MEKRHNGIVQFVFFLLRCQQWVTYTVEIPVAAPDLVTHVFTARSESFILPVIINTLIVSSYMIDHYSA